MPKKKYPKIKLIKADSVNDALQMVADNKAFGYVGTSLSSIHYIQKNFRSQLKIMNEFQKISLSIGIAKNDRILLSIMNKALSSIDEKQRIKIRNSWMVTTTQKPIDYTIIWYIIGIFITIIIVVIFFLIRENALKRELEERVKKEVEYNRQKERQLIHQSRLAQMGEMISMIAHQWRQPLTAISSTTNNLTFKLMMDDIDEEFFKEEIDLISNYSQHLSKTIDDFRGFFKNNREKEITTLEKIVNSTLDIVKTSIENKNIKIVTIFNCNENIETYSSELKQVVLNLIKNAEDVLLDKKVGNPKITIETKKEDDKKIIIIKDSGGGVPSDIKDKIFDPYFSTKRGKDGTGLGLYMSKTIIEGHCGGKISVSNNKFGALFKIEIL